LFARIATYELAEDLVGESTRAFRLAIERIRTLDGLVDAYFLVEPNGRHAVTLTIWETLDSMERSRVAASAARTDAAREAEAIVTSSYELEVGIHAEGLPAGAMLDDLGTA
jgi:heme-degrading monooxygenase HmoA